MAKIVSARELPIWFELEKYKGCDSFGAAEWYDVLDCRAGILLHLPYINHPELAGSSLQTKIASIRTNPLCVPEHTSRRQYIRLPARDLTFGDLLHRCRLERIAKSPDSARWDFFSSSFVPSEDVDEVLWAVDQTTVPLARSLAAVTVDLGATDSVILESFRRWLKDERASNPRIAPSRNKPAYASWARYGLLPYLDLRLWEMETGNQIPDKIMSRALSRIEHYEVGEENIRKTLAPIADDLMQDLSALRALAAIEAAKTPTESETFEG